MPNRIQPQDKNGPNNAGKMILRGCFLNVSRAWLEHDDNPIGGLLSRYLKNRLGEATTISLNHGDGIPPEREAGPEKIDMDFMASTILDSEDWKKVEPRFIVAPFYNRSPIFISIIDMLSKIVTRFFIGSVAKIFLRQNLQPLL